MIAFDIVFLEVDSVSRKDQFIWLDGVGACTKTKVVDGGFRAILSFPGEMRVV